MNRKIRKGVFETNSSSIHSLVISNEDREPSKFKLNKNGEIEIDFGQFGKDERIYTSQYDKLSYLITCLYYLSGYDISDIYDIHAISDYLAKSFENGDRYHGILCPAAIYFSCSAEYCGNAEDNTDRYRECF